MTEIVFDQENLVLSATGHTGGGSRGNDIICAAVSILIYTLAANVDALFGGELESKSRISLSSGAARIDCSSLKDDPRARAIFKNLCTGFELLSLRYPENVGFQRKEKRDRKKHCGKSVDGLASLL